MFNLGHKGGYMAIVKMQIADPLKLDGEKHVLISMIPTEGAGTGFAELLLKMFWGQLGVKGLRPMDSFFSWFNEGRHFFAVVCYKRDDYEKAPAAVEKFLKVMEKLVTKNQPLGFVLSSQDLPGPIQFKIMQVLEKSELKIQVFDYQY